MPENPSTFIFTMGVDTFLAIVALATGTNTGNQNLIALLEIGYTVTNFFNNTDAFMSQNSTALAGRYVSFNNMKISPADSGLYHTDNSVCWLTYDRFINIYKLGKSRFNISIGFHRISFLLLCYDECFPFYFNSL